MLGSYSPIYNGWTTGTVNLISIALSVPRTIDGTGASVMSENQAWGPPTI
ncbi:MAG: hypothetical protein VB142_10590 [Burkholderia sp.]